MAGPKANKYETGAKWSLALGALGVLCALALIGAVFTAFRPDDFEVVLKTNGARFFSILGCVGVAVISGAVGAFIGFNSVHQRNPKNNLAWMGFFLNSGALTLSLCVFVFFWLTKETIKL